MFQTSYTIFNEFVKLNVSYQLLRTLQNGCMNTYNEERQKIYIYLNYLFLLLSTYSRKFRYSYEFRFSMSFKNENCNIIKTRYFRARHTRRLFSFCFTIIFLVNTCISFRTDRDCCVFRGENVCIIYENHQCTQYSVFMI